MFPIVVTNDQEIPTVIIDTRPRAVLYLSGCLVALMTLSGLAQDELPQISGVQIRLAKNWPVPVFEKDAKITGRLYFFTKKKAGGEPRQRPDWFSPETFYALNVRDL